MMGRVGDNEPGQEPTGEWNAEQIRQFQEFQRFQAYLRFSESQGEPPAQQSGGELVPVQPQQPPPSGSAPAPQPGPQLPPGLPLDAQLAGMREQLARIERAANPPWWRKLLRSRLVRWPILLLILAAIGIWGVPALVNHYIGGTPTPGGASAAQPAPKTESNELPKSPNDTVSDLYLFIAGNHAPQACFLFDNDTKTRFAQQFHAATCEAAVATLNKQVTNAGSYGYPDLSLLPSAAANQTGITISSCKFAVSGGPRLGTFTLTKHTDGGWEITGYEAQQACPTTTTTVPTS